MTNDSMILRALTLAVDAHAGQTRYNGDPYVTHPLRVGGQVQAYGADAVAAALLHDVVEDTDVTLQRLQEQGFPPAVLAIVDALTRRPDEPYMIFIGRARDHSLARHIKVADIRDNMSDLSAGMRYSKYSMALGVLLS